MKVEVKLPDNAMVATVTLIDDGLRYDISESEILEALKDAGVRFGIDVEAIKEIVEYPSFDREYVVARGKPPVDGNDGKVIITKRAERERTESGGRVDLRELAARGRIIVRKGEVVGRMIKPTPGTPGVNVRGERVPPKPGNPSKMKVGRNLRVESDGRIVAEKDGLLRITEDQIYVEEVLEIKGDVDYSTGNVDFPGSVVVKGDVKPGFVVRARGDITVNGIVEAATLISYEGGIYLNGVKGQDKGMIRARKIVKAKFLESAHVECQGSVVVEGSITNSVVKSGNSVLAEGRRGTIVGGLITALKEISAEEIGSPIGVKTILEIGFDPEIREKEKILSAQIKLDEENLEKLGSILKDLVHIKEKSGGQLPPEKEELYEKVTQTIIHLKSSIEENKRELFRMRQLQRKSRLEARIVVRKKMHPGVKITIFNKEIEVDRPLGPVVLTVDEGGDRIKVVKRSG